MLEGACLCNDRVRSLLREVYGQRHVSIFEGCIDAPLYNLCLSIHDELRSVKFWSQLALPAVCIM